MLSDFPLCQIFPDKDISSSPLKICRYTHTHTHTHTYIYKEREIHIHIFTGAERV